jgi:fermentation-respiration switch protein FrsA (DUF1100 family)
MTGKLRKMIVIGFLGLTLAIGTIIGFGVAFETNAQKVETEFEIASGFTEAELRPGKNTVEFSANGETLVADLYLPADYVAGKEYPTIVVNPPASGVKEQTAGIYAEHMSQRGYAAMAIDPRGFGTSGGKPLLLDAYRIASDINASVAMLQSLQLSQKNRVYSLGICAGAGFAALAAINNAEIRAVGMVSPFLTSREDNYPNSVSRVLMRSAGGVARALDTNATGQLVPTQPEAIAQARGIVKGMTGYYLPGMPGETPNWKNALSIVSIGPVASFAIYDDVAELSKRPVSMIIGTEAVSREGGERLHNMLTGTKEKLMLEGADHFDLYYQDDYTAPASDHLAAFFARH